MSISFLANNITVAYEEVAQDGCPDEKLGETIEATRTLKCAFGSRWQLAQELLPFVTALNPLDVLVRMPHLYPYRTDLQLYATDVTMEPWATNPAIGSPGPHLGANVLAWEYAFLHVHYRSLQSGPTSLVWTEKFEPCAQFITLGTSKLYWDALKTDPVMNGSAPAFIHRKIEWTVQRRYAPIGFPPEVVLFQGTINTDRIVSSVYPGLVFEPYTLLYNGCNIEPDRFSDGSPAAKITMRFTGQNVDWDLFPHTLNETDGIMKFDQIYRSTGVGTSEPFYPYNDNTFMGNILGW
jgi:hypothetical protein